MTLDELKVIISANTSDYESSLKKISSQTKTTTTTDETQANKMSSAFAKVAATIGSLAIGAKIISIGTSAIEAASDLTEVQNVVDTASDMAISLAGLAGDVASFYNIDLDTAETKLQARLNH
ncbi:MAG: hypothetical protein LUF02_06795 [Erysipelotrichaceae bacterium]|nr:hypothetical protein [Erysipelotrichaceae bacterium]